MHALSLDVGSLFAAVGKVRELATGPDGTGSPDDGECVRRALRGDPWAEDVLYRRHVRAVATVVTRLLSRSHDAEDVVQEAFLSAFRDLSELRQAESFRSWLMQIAVRLVHRQFRRRALLRSFGLDRGQDDATLLSEVDPSAGPEVRTELSKLDDVLRTLPARDRVAWVLRHVEGYLLSEVASACRCSLATAKLRIGRAQRRIGAHVAVDIGEED